MSAALRGLIHRYPFMTNTFHCVTDFFAPLGRAPTFPPGAPPPAAAADRRNRRRDREGPGASAPRGGARSDFDFFALLEARAGDFLARFFSVSLSSAFFPGRSATRNYGKSGLCRGACRPGARRRKSRPTVKRAAAASCRRRIAEARREVAKEEFDRSASVGFEDAFSSGSSWLFD